MKPSRIFLALIFAVSNTILCIPIAGQTCKAVTGTIIDKKTKEPLAYASVSLKNNSNGTISNQNGEFRFLYPAIITNDTLLINYIGYKQYCVPVSSTKQHLKVKLLPKTVEIDEVIVNPLLPEDYIKRAVRKIRENYELSAYQTSSYYKTFLTQNDSVIFGEEAVFKTYHPDFSESKQNQHQLMLYRKPEEVNAFKWNEKRKKDSDSTIVLGGNGMISGGPEDVLSFDLSKQLPAFLDTNLFRDYNYTFGSNTYYCEKEIVCIEFFTINRVDSQIEDDVDIIKEKQSGKILIDKASLAIVGIELDANYIIPLYTKPLLSIIRLNIKQPSFRQQINYIQNAGKWYLKSIRNEYQAELVRQYMFGKNEHWLVKGEQVFCVNNFNFNAPKEIPGAKRFNASTSIEKQLFNDDELTWDNMNVIK